MNIAFVPARCGSKAIRFKNIKEFCGKPLIYWNLFALENAKEIDEVYVATDCVEISEVVEAFGFSKVKIYIRDRENAQDTSSTEDVVLEFLNQKSFNDNPKKTLDELREFSNQKNGVKKLAKKVLKYYDEIYNFSLPGFGSLKKPSKGEQ